MSDTDEWTSDIVSNVQKIVKKALTEERIAIVDILERKTVNCPSGEYCPSCDMIADLIHTIQNRKLNFRGVKI